MNEGDAEVQALSVYEACGGTPFFERLVEAFYSRVADDDVLRPMYPEADLGPAADRLCGFLVQYWGGPGDYSAQRGHPRLRMRHAPYAIDAEARQRWLAAMTAAVSECDPGDELSRTLLGYFVMAADAMVNTAG